jgi:hypothetical protein
VFHLGGGGTVQMTSMDDYLRINVERPGTSWTRRPTIQSATPPSSSANCKPSAIASPSRRVEAAEHSRHFHHSPDAVVR